MKRLYFAVWLFAAVACAGLNAQTQMQANIPFDFRMGDSLMPAGTYLIDCSTQVLTLRERDGNHVAHRLVNAVTRSSVATTGILEFNRYEDNYFLARVWTPYSEYGGALLKTSHERELASHTRTLQKTEIALQRK